MQEKEKNITPVVSTVLDDTSQTLIDTENGSLRANTPTSVLAIETPVVSTVLDDTSQTFIDTENGSLRAKPPTSVLAIETELTKCTVSAILGVTMAVRFLAKVRRIFALPKVPIRRKLTAMRQTAELSKAPSRRDNVVFLERISIPRKALLIL
jgi:hypothetical protein